MAPGTAANPATLAVRTVVRMTELGAVAGESGKTAMDAARATSAREIETWRLRACQNVGHEVPAPTVARRWGTSASAGKSAVMTLPVQVHIGLS